jgi:hypothetical protein
LPRACIAIAAPVYFDGDFEPNNGEIRAKLKFCHAEATGQLSSKWAWRVKNASHFLQDIDLSKEFY